jgi:hypothetical protein
MEAYEIQELTRANREEQQINRAPLSERKEAQADFLKDVREAPDHFADMTRFLLSGDFGHGQMLQAHNVTPRMNRVAYWTQLTALWNYRCPRVMAIAAWKKLSAKEKDALQREMEEVVREFDSREQ